VQDHPFTAEGTAPVFTGIVEEIGEIVEVTDLGDAARITVRGPLVTSDARPGDSIAVNGVCLTVVDPEGDTFAVDVMGETLRRSSLADVAPGARVNLERALAAGARLGGHIVQGHVDGVGEIVEPVLDLRVRMPRELLRYVVEKGSVAVDGVSLTVVDVLDDGFTVAVIPHTAAVTTLGSKQAGDRVNLEVDVTAKYVERLLAWKDV
jgi:riboflavin synthase